MNSSEILKTTEQMSSSLTESEFKEKCGKLIKKLRLRKKMTQATLGEICGVTDKQISKIETGNALPNLYMFIQILFALNGSFNDFDFLNHSKKTSLSSYQFDLYFKILECNPSKEICEAISTILYEAKR